MDEIAMVYIPALFVVVVAVVAVDSDFVVVAVNSDFVAVAVDSNIAVAVSALDAAADSLTNAVPEMCPV